MRCDLQEVYGVDIDGLEDGTLSWVRAAVLTSGLAPGCRLSKTWSQETHFIADQVDLLIRLNWLQGLATATALDKKDQKILKRPPAVLPRPGVEKKKPKFTDPAKLKEMLRLSHVTEGAQAAAVAAEQNKTAVIDALKRI